MTDVKRVFLSKLLNEEVDSPLVKNIASRNIEVILTKNQVEVRVIPHEPCEFIPVVESQRYKLEIAQCTDEDNARKIYDQGHADLASKIELQAADYNNLACAAMWVKLPSDSNRGKNALEWFNQANNPLTPGYSLLSDGSKSTIQQNIKHAEPPGPQIDIPLYPMLALPEFDELAKTLGLMKNPIEGLSIRSK